jgi:hypothetical protein
MMPSEFKQRTLHANDVVHMYEYTENPVPWRPCQYVLLPNRKSFTLPRPARTSACIDLNQLVHIEIY